MQPQNGIGFGDLGVLDQLLGLGELLRRKRDKRLRALQARGGSANEAGNAAHRELSKGGLLSAHLQVLLSVTARGAEVSNQGVEVVCRQCAPQARRQARRLLAAGVAAMVALHELAHAHTAFALGGRGGGSGELEGVGLAEHLEVDHLRIVRQLRVFRVRRSDRAVAVLLLALTVVVVADGSLLQGIDDGSDASSEEARPLQQVGRLGGAPKRGLRGVVATQGACAGQVAPA